MDRPRLVCRWVPDALEHYTAVLSEAQQRTDYHHDQTFKDGEVRVILTDLIAELRDAYAPDSSLDGWAVRASRMRAAADRAEARLRLREAQGEVGDGMSPNDPVSAIDRIAMAWESGYGEGHAEGYEVGIQDSMLRATLHELILQDLIAELRKRYGDLSLLEEYRPVLQACWKAETRLKEVQGEPSVEGNSDRQ